MKYSMYFIVQMSTIRSSGKEVEGNSSAETTEGINQIGMWIEHCSSYLKLNALRLFLKTTVTLITAIGNFATYLLHKYFLPRIYKSLYKGGLIFISVLQM